MLRKELLVLAFVSFTTQMTILVDKCPLDKQSWEKRAAEFHCNATETYHCIHNVNGQLMETCMNMKLIDTAKVGCPTAAVYHDGRMYPHITFIECDAMKEGCPNENHPPYKSNELYKYQACLQTRDRKKRIQNDGKRGAVSSKIADNQRNASQSTSCFREHTLIAVIIVIGKRFLQLT